ncbi:MAG: hypothetical protein AAGE18_09285 [Pseudomonadota bacterium]
MRSLLLCLSLLGPPAWAEPPPAFLVGTWTCLPKAGGPSFAWVVTEELPGGWLVGRGYESGVLTSLETWAHDDGQLHDRRQFSPRGAYIELHVIARTEDTLLSQGRATERDGTTVRLQHRLTRIGDAAFEAVWQVGDGGGWRPVADEVCTRDPA